MVEYAMEAVKQGSAAVGVKNKTHAVLAALKRSSSELSAYQKKVIPIDEHVGVALAGLTADARLLRYDAPLPVGRLLALLGNKLQIGTQRYDRRPFGVGLLLAGYDTCPSANYFDCRSMAIGARSQSARTYLEKHLEEFVDCDVNQLVRHALHALRDTLPSEVELTTRNCVVAIVGQNMPFTIYEDELVAPFINTMEKKVQERDHAATDPPADPTQDIPMETG